MSFCKKKGTQTNTVYGYGCAELQYAYLPKQGDEAVHVTKNKEKKWRIKRKQIDIPKLQILLSSCVRQKQEQVLAPKQIYG